MKPYLKNGLIAGVLVMLVYLISYAIKHENIQSGYLLITTNVIMFAAGLYSALMVRKANGGIMSYNVALGEVYITYLVALLVFNIINLVMIFLSTDLQNELVNMRRSTFGDDAKSLKSFDSMLQKTGVMRMILFQWITNVLVFGVFGLLISLILTIFVRKES